MSAPGSQTKKPSPVRQPVLLGLFTGTAVGAGFLLSGVPNVELMTLVVALSGATLGNLAGAACGAVAALAYSLGSPIGLPMPLLLAGQMAGLGLGGIIGSLAGKVILRPGAGAHPFRSRVQAGLAGLTAALVYDLLTNLAIIGSLSLEPVVVLGGAVPFAIVHLGFNAVVFALLFPVLGRRLYGLAETPLRGRSGTVMILLVLLPLALAGSRVEAQVPGSVPAGADSVATRVSPPDSLASLASGHGQETVRSWRRPLWEPFAPTVVQWLDWRTNWISVQDGGLGAPIVILGEAGTTPVPAFERDGIPLGTGHVLTDDPWLVGNQGLFVQRHQKGPDPGTGEDGLVSLATEDLSPGKALSVYRGLKGPHETYQRGISLLTPQAAWRLSFEFEEVLDNEGYNFSGEPDGVFRQEEMFPGHAKVRMSRTRLIRRLDPRTSLALEYSMGRKTKDSLPSLGAEHQEIWATGMAATMQSGTGDWLWRLVLHGASRDVRWGDRGDASGPATDSRLLETIRDGVSFDLVPAAAARDTNVSAVSGGIFSRPGPTGGEMTALGFRFSRWEVADSGADWPVPPLAETGGNSNHVHFYGQSGLDLGGVGLCGGITGSWDSRGGGAPGGFLGLFSASPGPAWKLEISRSGRAPRSDELLTPLSRNVNGTELFILPNGNLDREKTWRLQADLGFRLLGFDLALDSSFRRLRKGITWVPEVADPARGGWTNDLSMNSSHLTGSLGRQGRFLGWGRIKLEGTWQSWDEIAGKAVLLPPERYLRLELMWENHFFQEDGILEVALFSTRRGEMADPWDLTRTTLLPAVTNHDLLLGFRLVGVHLSLAIRNLTDQRNRLSAGAVSPGRELDLRLRWNFHY